LSVPFSSPPLDRCCRRCYKNSKRFFSRNISYVLESYFQDSFHVMIRMLKKIHFIKYICILESVFRENVFRNVFQMFRKFYCENCVL